MTLALGFLIVGLVAGGVGFVVGLIVNAPEGYETEDGFFLGTPPDAAE